MDSSKKETTLLMIQRAASGESLEQMLKEIKKTRKLNEILLPKLSTINRGAISNEALAELIGCSRAYVYGIMNGKKHPEKDILLRIAFVLGMSVDETQEMLKTAQRAILSSKDKRDICIIFGLANGLDLESMDEVLINQGELPLSVSAKDDKQLRDILSFHMKKNNMTAAQLLPQIKCSADTLKSILRETIYAPRDLLIRIAFVLQIELSELQNMLRMEKQSALSIRDERDMYIMNGLANKVSPAEIEERLSLRQLAPLWETIF